MDSFDFGPTISNETLPSIQDVTHVYSAENVALILGALSACVAGVVYSFKNIKHSTCCAGLFTCDQRTELPPSKESFIIESSNV